MIIWYLVQASDYLITYHRACPDIFQEPLINPWRISGLLWIPTTFKKRNQSNNCHALHGLTCHINTDSLSYSFISKHKQMTSSKVWLDFSKTVCWPLTWNPAPSLTPPHVHPPSCPASAWPPALWSKRSPSSCGGWRFLSSPPIYRNWAPNSPGS